MRENLRYSHNFTSMGSAYCRVEESWEHSLRFELRCDNVLKQQFSLAALCRGRRNCSMQTCHAREVSRIGIWEEALVISELLIS